MYPVEDAFKFFSDITGLNSEAILQCWGLSKMLVDNEIKQRPALSKANFSEFLELFARVAEVFFKDDPLHKDKSMPDKIALLMDLSFPIIGKFRCPTVVSV